MKAASATADPPSYIDEFATSIARSSEMSDWYSKIDCSVPWLTSGWYGVYAVRNSPRRASTATADGRYRRCTGPPRKKGPAPAERFFAASDSRCAWISSSDIPTGRPSFGRSASLGIAVSRSSTLFMPTRSSIAARSASVCDEYGFLFNLWLRRGDTLKAGGLAPRG